MTTMNACNSRKRILNTFFTAALQHEQPNILTMNSTLLCPSIQSRTPHREPLANLSELSPNLPIAVYSTEKPCLIVKSGEKHDLLARETWSGTTRMATAKSWRCSPPAKMKNMHGRANVHRGFQIALPVAHNPWPTSLPIERPREGLRVGAIMR